MIEIKKLISQKNKRMKSNLKTTRMHKSTENNSMYNFNFTKGKNIPEQPNSVTECPGVPAPR